VPRPLINRLDRYIVKFRTNTKIYHDWTLDVDIPGVANMVGVNDEYRFAYNDCQPLHGLRGNGIRCIV